MAIELAEDNETPAPPGQFTQAQVDGIRPLLERIAGGAFSYLIARNNAPRLDDCNAPNDAISIGAYSIVRVVEPEQRRTLDKVGHAYYILTPSRIAYEVYVTRETAAQTYWQPADYDDFLLAKVGSLNDAIVLIVTEEIRSTVRSYEEEQAYRRDHEEPEHPGGTSA